MSQGRLSAWMKLFLRNKGKGLYYASCNRWVADPSQACDFDEIEHAGQLAFEEGISEVEVVLSYGDSKCELAVPVRLEWDGGQSARIAA